MWIVEWRRFVCCDIFVEVFYIWKDIKTANITKGCKKTTTRGFFVQKRKNSEIQMHIACEHKQQRYKIPIKRETIEADEQNNVHLIYHREFQHISLTFVAFQMQHRVYNTIQYTHKAHIHAFHVHGNHNILEVCIVALGFFSFFYLLSFIFKL